MYLKIPTANVNDELLYQMSVESSQKYRLDRKKHKIVPNFCSATPFPHVDAFGAHYDYGDDDKEDKQLFSKVLLQHSITTEMAEGTNMQEDLIVKNSVQFVQSSFNVHTFSDKILDNDVFFHVLKMSESFYIWIGKSNRFGEFSVAMTVKDKQPSSTVLIGGNASETVTLAEKLSKKTGKQVFVGGELDNFSHLELPLVEKRIAEEMKSNSDKFL